MHKQKTHSGAKKRFKITGSGKLMKQQAGMRHNLEVKATFSTRDTPEVVKARLARAERIAAAVKAAKAAAEAKPHAAVKTAGGSWLSRLVGRLLGR